jgi:hypothetical protein
MTVETILNAYQALKKLEDFALPIEKSYALYLLNEEIDKKYKFFMQKEKDLIETYQASIGNEGMISFNSKEDMEAFQVEHEKIFNLEIEDFKINKITLTKEDLGENKISSKEVSVLIPFIDFALNQTISIDEIEKED